ncbi:hypothetical protein CR513_21585, partial [Mucuna pruriens]
MNMVRIIVSLATHSGLNLQQFEVKNSFLRGELEKEVYMEILPRFYSHNEKNKSQGDHTLFIKHLSDDKLTFLLVYVDNMIITGDDKIEKLILKEKLTTHLEMKDLGKLKYFLGKRLPIPNKYCLVVSVVNHFMHDSRKRHLWAVEMILQHLKTSLGKGL